MKNIGLGLLFLLKATIESINIKPLIKWMKHQILIGSWWRATIMFLIVGGLSTGINIILVPITVLIFYTWLNIYQRRYSIDRESWSNVHKNDHLIIPFVMSISIIIIYSIALYPHLIPKYEIIRTIQINSNTITDGNIMYFKADGISHKVVLNTKCKGLSSTVLYKKTIDSSWMKYSWNVDYDVDCNEPIRKYNNIHK